LPRTFRGVGFLSFAVSPRAPTGQTACRFRQIDGECAMRNTEWSRRLVLSVAVMAASGLGGCKAMSEKYIKLEVWKYERCFGHLPPGFVPPGAIAPAMAAPAAQPCGQGAAPCQSAPCQNASFAPGDRGMGDNCNNCQGGTIEGGMPASSGPSGTFVPGLPAGPGGSPGPMPSANLPTPAGMTTGKPIILSDEVVLP